MIVGVGDVESFADVTIVDSERVLQLGGVASTLGISEIEQIEAVFVGTGHVAGDTGHCAEGADS